MLVKGKSSVNAEISPADVDAGGRAQAARKVKLSTSKKVLLMMSVTILVASGIFAWVLYINDYYHATEKAQKAMLGNALVEVTETEAYYLFSCRTASSEDKRGIIFYPGGKVEETAYAPLLLQFAEAGYEVYLVKMPARLAVFGVDRASDIMNTTTDVAEWTMMGHSLGGAMAAAFAADHAEEVDNLVLLAAYSTKNLSDADMDVYSFYGSEDEVLNRERYQKYADNLSEDRIETVIDGGNHAYYAHYGEQKGDGAATITREEQQETVIDVFLSCEEGSDFHNEGNRT